MRARAEYEMFSGLNFDHGLRLIQRTVRLWRKELVDSGADVSAQLWECLQVQSQLLRYKDRVGEARVLLRDADELIVLNPALRPRVGAERAEVMRKAGDFRAACRLASEVLPQAMDGVYTLNQSKLMCILGGKGAGDVDDVAEEWLRKAWDTLTEDYVVGRNALAKMLALLYSRRGQRTEAASWVETSRRLARTWPLLHALR